MKNKKNDLLDEFKKVISELMGEHKIGILNFDNGFVCDVKKTKNNEINFGTEPLHNIMIAAKFYGFFEVKDDVGILFRVLTKQKYKNKLISMLWGIHINKKVNLIEVFPSDILLKCVTTGPKGEKMPALENEIYCGLDKQVCGFDLVD